MQSTAESRVFFVVGGGSFSPMIGWRQFGAFVHWYHQHKNLTAFISPTQQEIAVRPTLHTEHSQTHIQITGVGYCAASIECAIILPPDTKTQKQLSAHGATSCVSIVFECKIRQRQAAWRLTQRWIREQTGLTKGSLTVTLSRALGALPWSRDSFLSSEDV